MVRQNETVLAGETMTEHAKHCGCAGLVEFPAMKPVPGINRDDCQFPALVEELEREREKWTAQFAAVLINIEDRDNLEAERDALKARVNIAESLVDGYKKLVDEITRMKHESGKRTADLQQQTAAQASEIERLNQANTQLWRILVKAVVDNVHKEHGDLMRRLAGTDRKEDQ